MPAAKRPRLTTVRREGERVMPLELFFDLVFVLALTQCTALMAKEPTWAGLAKSLVILGLLWWSWVGYAWLTSVVNPDEGGVRLVVFASMAAFLVVALCIPEAFDDRGLLFACAYAVTRVAQLVLLTMASEGDAQMRRSIKGLWAGSLIGISLVIGGSFLEPGLQGVVWAVALLLDMGEPYIFGSEGWKLMPGHFAERHALIIIIALGESIVAIGVGTESLAIGAGEVTVAILGVGVAAALWWLYFDVVALVAEHRLANAEPGKEQNEIARDSFSYLHFPMVAGIVLMALGLKKTIGHIDEPLKLVPAAALLGGGAVYLLAHVGFRWRNVHRFSSNRMIAAAALVVLIPLHAELDAIFLLALALVVLAALCAYETIFQAQWRNRLRSRLSSDGG